MRLSDRYKPVLAEIEAVIIIVKRGEGGYSSGAVDQQLLR